MIKINLIREGKSAARGASGAGSGGSSSSGPSNINNILLMAMLGLGVLAAAGYWFIKNRQEAAVVQQVAERAAEAQKLESIIKEVDDYKARKTSLETKIQVINDLKKNQKGPVRILDRISQDLPDLVWMEKMILAGPQISVEGRGLNPNAIANFVKNIADDPLFDEPAVGDIKQESAGVGMAVYRYTMTFNFSYATTDATGQPAVAGAGGEAATSTAAAPKS